MNPLFTNDLAGFVKLLAALVAVVLLPIAALVIYFLKLGPDKRLDAFEVAMNGFGARVNLVENKHERLDERLSAIPSQITESQRDVMIAIRASADAQLKALHDLDKQVAVLKERNDLGDCLISFGKSIEKLVHDQDAK